MARGNETIVSSNPRGVFMEGTIGAGVTAYAGMILQIDPSVALIGGRHTFKLYARSASGDRPTGPLYILTVNNLLGKPITYAYTAGDRAFLYSPVAGEEFNLLLADVAGTGDSHAIGEVLMIQNNTGKLIATTGSPQSNPFVLLEAVAVLTADSLAWCLYNGY